ncbi:MAG TPA: ATP-binding protein [Steroidobacteraceae bacterium]|nr:ATP-binding protein [Steroidobacteraceae bacterium]
MSQTPTRRRSHTRPQLEKRLTRLREENLAMRKTVRALMDRVERAVDDQGTPFSWFQAAAKLEEAVRQRTEQYEKLNARLSRELESRREIELALKQAKQQADLANQSKTRFLAAASHDLRQPLNSAVLFLESIDEEALRESDRSLVHRSRLALASLNNLLGTLLDVARLDSGGIEPRLADFPVGALLDRLGPEFQAVARSAGIELEIVRSRVWVHTDLRLLETVLRNFISNAIRYTPRGRVVVGCRRRSQGLMIGVYDTGIGIEREHLDAIFDPYYQVPHGDRRSGVGIGLGLSIVSRIVRMLSLERIVRSHPGTGSMFAVVVPYGSASADLPADLTAESPVLVQHCRPLTVVVIDDSPEALLGMSAVLEKWGCRPVTAANPTDAVVHLISSDLEPDLVISDYHLAGGLKGDAAIAQVRQEFDRAPATLIMTSDPDPRLRERLQSQGLAVLEKPLNLAKLRALIGRLPG